jgi:ABC-type transport system involved in cytochrome c biogenesis ATPase subunit
MKQEKPEIEMVAHSPASVVPELARQVNPPTTTTTAAVPEQIQLNERSKQRQFVALMKKHYSAYKRDTETLYSEILSTVFYTILLYVFALTASTEITDSATHANGAINLTTSTTAAYVVPFNSFNSENYTSACDGQDCYVAFGDTDVGTGCSDELNELLNRIPMCTMPQRRPFFDPKTLGCNDPNLCGGASTCFSTAACQDRGTDGQWPASSPYHACNAGAACAPCFGNCNDTSLTSTTVSDLFTNYTGIHIPKCQCFPTSGYSNYTYVQEERIVAAVRFEPGFGNRSGYNYTMYLSGPKIPLATTKFKSPLLQSGTSYPQSGQFKSTALQLQVAIDSAITGQDIAVGVADFPTAKIESWKPGGFFHFSSIDKSLNLLTNRNLFIFSTGELGNVPLYLTVMLFLGLQSFAGQLAEEGEKGLRQALFMVGLEPVVYWMSWVVILFGKLLFTSTLIFIILGTVMPHFDFIGTVIPFVLLCIWATEFPIFLGLIEAKSKTAQGAVAFLPTLFSVIPTVLAFILGNNPDAESAIPGWVHITLGAIGPPYAFAMLLTEMLTRTNSLDGGLRVQKYDRVGSTGVSPLSMVLCLVAGDLILFGVNWYLSSKKLGIARKKKTFDDGDDENGIQRKWSTGGEEGGVAVSIRGLRKEWGSLKAVDGLTVDFMDNQITGFLGHNGAGKSTTIKLLTGLYNVTGGDAYVYGNSVDKNMSSVREMIGVCPQDNIFWDRLTVYEHMELLAHIRGVEPEAVKGHIDVLLKDVGLLRSKGILGSSLSGTTTVVVVAATTTICTNSPFSFTTTKVG